MKKIALALLTCLSLSIIYTGCSSLKKPSDITSVEQSKKVIIKGMTAENVVELLGPTPNILQDKKGRSVMIYDRIPASSVQLSSSDKNTLLIFDPIVETGSDEDENEPPKKQKNFTVIIKFDKDNLVADYEFYPSIF